MSRRDSRISLYVQTSSELEFINELRQLAIAKHNAYHYQTRSAPTSAANAAPYLPNTPTRQAQSFENEVTIFDNVSFALGLGQNEARASVQSSFPSSSPSAPSSSTLSVQVETTMTQDEVETWAPNHNPLFLDCLNASISARSHATLPYIQRRNHSPMYASTGVSNMAFVEQYRHGNCTMTPVETTVPVPQCALAPIPQPFSPNTMVWKRMGIPNRSASGNYLGNRSLTSDTREVHGLPDWRNCALFLTNIPVEATLHDIFGVIKTGAVFCLHINQPTTNHQTKAAKLAFMTPEAAAAFLAQIDSIDGVVLHGHRIRGRYNRNGYVRNESNWQSRVLHLVGPTPIMTLEFWTSRFATFSNFELEYYSLSPDSVDGRSKVEFRFARVDGQAQTCLQCIKTDPTLKNIVHVKYGIDPCGSSVS